MKKGENRPLFFTSQEVAISGFLDIKGSNRGRFIFLKVLTEGDSDSNRYGTDTNRGKTDGFLKGTERASYRANKHDREQVGF